VSLGVRVLQRWRAALRRRSAWWLYGNARYSRHERRLIRRRWVQAGLFVAVALGVIVFAVFAFGRDPFESATLTNGPMGGVSASGATSFESEAANGEFAAAIRTAGLMPDERKREVDKLSHRLALATIDASGGQLQRAALPSLSSAFQTLLTTSGGGASVAAGSLLSMTSSLTEAHQRLVLGAIDGVFHGVTDELGKKGVDALIDSFAHFGTARTESRIPTVIVNIPAGDDRVQTVPATTTVKVEVTLRNRTETPVSFLWFARVWRRENEGVFEGAFRRKHPSGDAQRALATFFLCHSTVRRVFGIAGARAEDAAVCHSG
jgi:hypothetical protein